MADNVFTSAPISTNQTAFSGGLNTTAGPFAVGEVESTSLQNIDFNIFGSILKRNGYLNVNSSAIASVNSDGLAWYEYTYSGAAVRKLVNVINNAFYKMDTSAGEPDGTWDDATNSKTITADNMCDFNTWHNKIFFTNGYDTPLVYDGTSLTTAVLPSNVTRPKFVTQFNNYQFYANVFVSGASEGSRFYWSDFNDESTWTATSFVRVSDNDGTDITGQKVFADRLVQFKSRSIYNVFFTGDPDVPFVVQKSNSPVGCVSHWSIQDVQNGLVFLANDGFYLYDGNNSYKISDKITVTLNDYDFSTARSCVQYSKNRYFCSLKTSDGTSYAVFVWDFFNNGWSLYAGLTVSAMARVFINGIDERPYFADNSGYAYRMDYGLDDYPAGVRTAINSYYYTNWKPAGDLVIQKSYPEVILYHTIQDTSLTFVYSYDFDTTDRYSETLSLSQDSLTWDEGLWDVDVWDREGGMAQMIVLAGRGRVIRIGFKNSTLGETFRIDGMGLYVRGETARS